MSDKKRELNSADKFVITESLLERLVKAIDELESIRKDHNDTRPFHRISPNAGHEGMRAILCEELDELRLKCFEDGVSRKDIK